MNTPTKLAGFALVLVAAFGAAAGLGNAVGPMESSTSAAEHATMNMGGEDAAAGGSASEEIPGGLLVSQDGYTLELAQNSLPVGAEVPMTFRVLGPDGAPVTAYDVTHDKDLHLIVVRRDLTGFQHVHPELAENGTWSIPLALTAGQWRVFADFAPTGHGDNLILGADLAVAGGYDPSLCRNRPIPLRSTGTPSPSTATWSRAKSPR